MGNEFVLGKTQAGRALGKPSNPFPYPKLVLTGFFLSNLSFKISRWLNTVSSRAIFFLLADTVLLLIFNLNFPCCNLLLSHGNRERNCPLIAQHGGVFSTSGTYLKLSIRVGKAGPGQDQAELQSSWSVLSLLLSLCCLLKGLVVQERTPTAPCAGTKPRTQMGTGGQGLLAC